MDIWIAASSPSVVWGETPAAAILLHLKLLGNHLELYNLAFSGKLFDLNTFSCYMSLYHRIDKNIPWGGILPTQPGGVCREEEYTPIGEGSR